MSGSVPDMIEPVVGWRAWRVDHGRHGAGLMSVTRAEHWPVGSPLVAACPRTPLAHPAPWSGCGCGIHAARTVEEAAYYTGLPSRADDHLAVGLVALWGTVVEGEHGWRASHAYPQRIALMPPRGAGARERYDVAFGLADYGVPVEIVACPRTAITGRLVVDWVRPQEPLGWPFRGSIPG